MIIYNVTTKVNAEVAEAWLAWLKEEHIPDVLGTGCFTGFQIFRLLESGDLEGPTYVTQYMADSIPSYKKYIQVHAPEMRQKAHEKWGDAFIAFRSVMEVVN